MQYSDKNEYCYKLFVSLMTRNNNGNVLRIKMKVLLLLLIVTLREWYWHRYYILCNLSKLANILDLNTDENDHNDDDDDYDSISNGVKAKMITVVNM